MIAHEIGHHVQNLLGIENEVDQASAARTRTSANALSVRLELQADCLAGVWAHSAATQGDPRARRHRGGRSTPRPPSATTGSRSSPAAVSIPTRSRTAPPSSASRGSARGFDTGDPNACDTFAGDVYARRETNGQHRQQSPPQHAHPSGCGEHHAVEETASARQAERLQAGDVR